MAREDLMLSNASLVDARACVSEVCVSMCVSVCLCVSVGVCVFLWVYFCVSQRHECGWCVRVFCLFVCAFVWVSFCVLIGVGACVGITEVCGCLYV